LTETINYLEHVTDEVLDATLGRLDRVCQEYVTLDNEVGLFYALSVRESIVREIERRKCQQDTQHQ